MPMTSDANGAFKVGDRVKAFEPVNESWPPEHTATVTATYPSNRMDIRWDHGPCNNGHSMDNFIAAT
jgi:hypothetical protein